MGRRWAILVLAAAALVAAAAAVAGGGDREQVHLNAADSAAARAVVLRRSDLPPSAEWQGGMKKKPDLSSGGVACANFHPKRSDLIVTGGAESDFSHGIFYVTNLVKVFKTARMVRVGWQRVDLAPGLLPCLRRYLARGAPAGWQFVSIERLSFPKVAPYTDVFRMVIGVTAAGSELRILLDFAMIARGRTLIELLTGAPYVARAAVKPEEIRLARTLVARIRT